MECPLDYSLCAQTVTLYRLCDGQVLRQVLPRVFYQWQQRSAVTQFGEQEDRLFILIVPGAVTLLPGDRIYDGEGPALTQDQWQGFLPVHVPGLSQIAYVKPCYWEGRLCHTEAGRK